MAEKHSGFKLLGHILSNLFGFTDNDGDTAIEVEQSADEDKVRIKTGGTERAIIDSTGHDFKDHQALNHIIENRTNDTGMTVTGQIWFRTDV